MRVENLKLRVALAVALSAAAFVLVATLLAGIDPAEAAFPGANGKIAFTSTSQSIEGMEIVSANPAVASPITNLTHSGSRDDNAEYSPSGKKIAFVSNRDAYPNSGTREVYSMSAGGALQTRLTKDPADDYDPAWSPGGKKIAFVSTRGGSAEVYTMNPDGTGVKRLTNNTLAEENLAWSPDGTKIAFNTLPGLAFFAQDIYVMNADGTRPRNLTQAAYFGVCPSWSPNGKKIAFEGKQMPLDGAPITDTDTEVFVMNPDGTLARNLTNNPSAQDREPAWSPDGTKIAFWRFSGNDSEIFVMGTNGAAQTPITSNSENDSRPTWQPLP